MELEGLQMAMAGLLFRECDEASFSVSRMGLHGAEAWLHPSSDNSPCSRWHDGGEKRKRTGLWRIRRTASSTAT